MIDRDALLRGVSKGYFTKRAVICPDYYRHREWMWPFERKIIKDMKPESKVLDVGCGGGRIAVVLAREGHQVTGIDYVPEMRKLAEERLRAEGYNGEFVTADATSLPYGDETFDHVVCLGNTINNINCPLDVRLTIWEAVRVLKKGGVAYLTAVNPLSPMGIMLVSRGLTQRVGEQRLPFGCYAYTSGEGANGLTGIARIIRVGEFKRYLGKAKIEYKIKSEDNFMGRGVLPWFSKHLVIVGTKS